MHDIWLAFTSGMIGAFTLSFITSWTAWKRKEKKNPHEITIISEKGVVMKVEFNGMSIKKIRRLVEILWENENDEERPEIR